MAPGWGRQVLRVGHSGLGLPHRQVPVEASFPLNRACRCLEGSSLWTPDSQLWGGRCTAQGGPSCTPSKSGTAPPCQPAWALEELSEALGHTELFSRLPS